MPDHEQAAAADADGITDSPDARIAVHCPKCSQLHMFSAADAVAEREVAMAGVRHRPAE